MTVSKFNSDTATKIVVKSPAGTAGVVDVTVTTAGGTSLTTAADQFTYLAAPALRASAHVGAAGGRHAGDDHRHEPCTAATARSISAGCGEDHQRHRPRKIEVKSPAGKAGLVDVTVATPGGVSAIFAADQFTYVAAPTVTESARRRARLAQR